jgi:hypothetical protein
VLYASQFGQLSQVTSENGIIIILSANGVLTPDSGSKLGLYDQGQCRRSLLATRATGCSKILRFSGK